VTSEDLPPPETVLEALSDPDCQSILAETNEPMTANELEAACEIPQSTLYRKLELLGEASLVQERDTINPSGGRVTYYERAFTDVLLSMDENGDLSVAIEWAPQSAEKRLADIWSMMGEEV
jgi:DNA-binding transcriptional ArsR family regulator